MKILKVIIILVLSLLTIYLIQYALVGLGSVDISDYSGDGKIVKIGSGRLAKGFKVSFDDLDLKKKSNNHYTINNLPLLDRDYVFMLEVDDGNNKKENTIDASITIIVSLDNNKLIDLNREIKESISTRIDSSGNLYYFLNKNNSSIINREKIKKGKIDITFNYSPRNHLSQEGKLTGRLVLLVGGSI